MTDTAPQVDVQPRCASCGSPIDVIRCGTCALHDRIRMLVARAELVLIFIVIIFAIWAVLTFGGH